MALLQDAIATICEELRGNYKKQQIIDDDYGTCFQQEIDDFVCAESMENKKKLIEEFGGFYKAMKTFDVEVKDYIDEEHFVSCLAYSIIGDEVSAIYDTVISEMSDE